MIWNESRPLHTDPGRALAVEIVDSPARAHEIVTGALEGLLYIDCLATDLPLGGGATLLSAYLRGTAAAAIVVDSARGTRKFTSASDYAVGGNEVVFLPLGATLGMLTVASSAMGQAPWVLSQLARTWVEPEGHRATMEELREKATLAARAKISKGGARLG
jgi:hypothetical protein